VIFLSSSNFLSIDFWPVSFLLFFLALPIIPAEPDDVPLEKSLLRLTKSFPNSKPGLISYSSKRVSRFCCFKLIAANLKIFHWRQMRQTMLP